MVDIIGSHLLSLQTADSTNTWLVQQSQRKDLPDGTVVIAEHQRAGRGQQGNRWLSQPNVNLTLSVLLQPKRLPARNAFLLNKLAALAVRDAAQQLVAQMCPQATPRLQVKWPNDVMADGKKIAGILIENVVQSSHITQSVVGIGLNVNWHPKQLPASCLRTLAADAHIDTGHALQVLLDMLNHYYRLVQLQQYDKLDSAYLKHLWLYRTPHTFHTANEKLKGTLSGISPEGQLIIELETGTRLFSFKEISF